MNIMELLHLYDSANLVARNKCVLCLVSAWQVSDVPLLQRQRWNSVGLRWRFCAQLHRKQQVSTL